MRAPAEDDSFSAFPNENLPGKPRFWRNVQQYRAIF